MQVILQCDEGPDQLHLCGDGSRSASAYREWVAMLKKGAMADEDCFRLLEHPVSFRLLGPEDSPEAVELWMKRLPYVPVQVARTDTTGGATETAVATSDDGARFLIRRIRGSAGHPWRLLCPIDGVPPRIVRARTAHFVETCWARTLDDASVSTAPSVPEQGAGHWARAGSFFVASDPPSFRVQRVREFVAQQLAEVLLRHGYATEKPMPAGGFDLDALVRTPAGSFLILVATDVEARDVGSGLGQLLAYRALLPRHSLEYADASLLFLLPAAAPSALQQGFRALGVELHQFRMCRIGRHVKATFPPGLLARFGIANAEAQPSVAETN